MTFFPIAASKLTRTLGFGMPVFSILSSVAFTVCLFFYVYFVGAFFRISIYPLINRVTFYGVFEEYVISENLDSVIAIIAVTIWFLVSVNNRTIRYFFSLPYGISGILLAVFTPGSIIFDIVTLLSLPLIGIFSLYSHRSQRKIVDFDAKLTLHYITLLVIAFSAIGIFFHASAVLLSPELDSFDTRNSYASELFLLFSSPAIYLTVIIVFCLPVKVLLKEALSALKLDIKEDIRQTIPDEYRQHGRRLKTQLIVGFLILAILLSIILVLVPHHPSINRDDQDVGVDTHYYVMWIGELAKSGSISDFVYQAFIVQGQDGDRPLSLIFLFLVYHIVGGNLSQAIEYSPIILGPGIVLATYFLTLELIRNQKIALISAFISAVSFHTLAGIYAGYYANWFSLILGYVSMGFLFRYLRSGSLSNILVFSALLMGVLFSHVYTWTVLTAVAVIFLVSMLVAVIHKKKDIINNNNSFIKRRIIWLLLAILLTVVVDVSKVSLTGSSGGLDRDIELAQTNLGIDQFNLRWLTLNITIYHSLGGVFSNFIILTLGLFWILKSNMHEPPTIFLMIFLSAGLVPLFFGNWEIQARVFYDMPFEIPAAISLYYISKRLNSILVPLAACTWLVAISLFTVMNYYLISV
jgi:hypothetical protein